MEVSVEQEGRKSRKFCWSVKEYKWEAREGKIMIQMGISEREIAWPIGRSRWIGDYSKGRYHQAFGLLAQKLLLSAANDKSSLLLLVIMDFANKIALLEWLCWLRQWLQILKESSFFVLAPFPHPPDRRRAMIRTFKNELIIPTTSPDLNAGSREMLKPSWYQLVQPTTFRTIKTLLTSINPFFFFFSTQATELLAFYSFVPVHR